MEFSGIAICFIENAGEISGKSNWEKHSKGPQGGIALPCTLCWAFLNERHVKNLDALLVAERVKILSRYGLNV